MLFLGVLGVIGRAGEVLTIALLLALLALLNQVTIIGPGTISYAGNGTLERVAERRLKNGWGLTQDWRGYGVLVAPADCDLLGRSGWIVTSGSVIPALVVDCENAAHAGQMDGRGLLVDINKKDLTHKRGWLILR